MKMKKELIREEEDILALLIEYYYNHKRMPTRKQIGEMLGISAQLVQFRLRKLEQKKYIEIIHRKKGGIMLK